MAVRRYLTYLIFPLAICAMALPLVFAWKGLEGVWITLVLLALEISLSFDNAVVNARVLERLTPGQQSFFLSWGLVIPVFGVRFAGPLVMVALAGGAGFGEAFNAAMHDPARYRQLLSIAEPRILAFGGMFLLMVFLRYFLDEAKTLHWFKPLERKLSLAGRVESLEIAVALIVLLALDFFLPNTLQDDMMIAGVCGLVLQLLTSSIANLFGDEEQASLKVAARGGLVSLLYLELLDASFSLDGTIGAFAITTNLGLILTGLGLGALFIRSLTVMITRERTLDKLVYLEHGAHYAIGALGLVMLLQVVLRLRHIHIPEWLTGLIGLLVLLGAFYDSRRQLRRQISRAVDSSAP
ncbi:MAG: DUF475 domain-containing protein [Synechococcus sp. ELA057]|jgi:hypothetical protein